MHGGIARRTVGDRLLPKSASALLNHVQGRVLESNSDELTSKLLRLLHCLSPRVIDDESAKILDIDLNVLRAVCIEGIPNESFPARSALWKLLLGYLPSDMFEWDKSLLASRRAYACFVKELLEDMGEDADQRSTDQEQSLPSKKKSGALNDVLEQIQKDIYRTRVELSFFAQRIDSTCGMLDSESNGAGILSGMPVNVHEPRCHYDALARILLLYGKLNPLIQYVQGMNELCAPLYYVFSHDALSKSDAEADTFFCLSLLMSPIHEAFIKSMDYEDNGLMDRLDQFSNLLRSKDYEVWKHLDDKGVQPAFYAVKWLTLMLSQEFDILSVLRLWDAFLGDLARPHPLLHYVCIAKVVLVREVLLASDFADCLQTLQHYPPYSAEKLLRCALQIRAADLAPEGFSNHRSAWTFLRWSTS